MSNKKTVISATDNTILELKLKAKELSVVAEEKESIRLKLKDTAKNLAVVAKDKESIRSKLEVIAKEKEDVRQKLVVTAKQLATTAEEKENTRSKLAVTAKELKVKAEDLVVTAKEKEDIRRKLIETDKKLAATAKEKESVRSKLVITAENLAVTAKEKENIRLKLEVTAKDLAETAEEKEDIRRKLAVTADEVKLKAKNLAVTAEEKEDIRLKLEITTNELKVKAEELLRKSKENFHDLVESISDVFFAMDKNLRYTYWNKASEKLTGIPAEKAIGKKLIEIQPDNEARQQMIDKCLQVIKTKQPQNWIINYPGNLRIVHEVSAYPTTEGVCVFAKDVTNRRKLEEEVSQDQFVLNEAQGLAKIGSWSWDVIADKITWSEELYSIFKRDPKEKPITSLKDLPPLYTPESYALLNKAIKNTLKTDMGYHLELELICMDGTHRWGDTYGKVVKDERNKVSRLYGTVQDISERKKAEEAVKESQLILQNIIDLLPVRVFWKDRDLNYLGANKTLALDAGWKFPADLIGKDDFKMAWKDHANSYREDDMKVIVSGKPKLDYEEPSVTPTGEESWVNTNKVPLKDKAGKIQGILGTYIDVTQRKKMEESLTRLALITESTSDYASIADMKGKLLYLNDSGRKMIGLDKNVDIEKLKISDVHPAWASQIILKKGIPSAIKNGTWSGETALIHRGGHEIPVSQVIVAHKDKDGKIDLLSTVIRDITEQKNAENILKENEERYRTLINVVPLCIKWFDEKGNLISVNQHGKEEHFLVGKNDEEIKNWKYMECIEEKYRDLVKESMRKALEGESSEFDMEHVPGTSTGHWCHSYLVPASDDKGKVVYVLFISRDFTAEKIAEEEKNKNLEMLEKFKELTVGRELKMIELKKEIEGLKQREGGGNK